MDNHCTHGNMVVDKALIRPKIRAWRGGNPKGNLLQYCKLDTLATVRLHESLLVQAGLQ